MSKTDELPKRIKNSHMLWLADQGKTYAEISRGGGVSALRARQIVRKGRRQREEMARYREFSRELKEAVREWRAGWTP